MFIAGLRFIQSIRVVIQQDAVKKDWFYFPNIMDNIFWKLHQSQEDQKSAQWPIVIQHKCIGATRYM
jgi:hypothetical protein